MSSLVIFHHVQCTSFTGSKTAQGMMLPPEWCCYWMFHLYFPHTVSHYGQTIQSLSPLTNLLREILARIRSNIHNLGCIFYPFTYSALEKEQFKITKSPLLLIHWCLLWEYVHFQPHLYLVSEETILIVSEERQNLQ